MLKNILIYRLGSLGDSIIALPAFHGVRRAFPDAHITLLTNRPIGMKAPPVESVLGKGYFFNRVLDYPVGTRNPMVLIKLLCQLRSCFLEGVFNLAEFRSDRATHRDRAFFRLAGLRHFYGFDLAKEDQEALPHPVTGEVEWEAARIARRVQPVAEVNLESPDFWDLRLTVLEKNDAAQCLAPVPSLDRVLALSTGTKVQAKHWGVENWVELSRRLSKFLKGWTAVFFGSSSETEESAACQRVWEGPSLNLCGACPPRVSAAIMERCQAFVGHDSGPMHLAACVGLPCVAIFSARNLPHQWFPRGDGHRILYHKTDCAGCGLEECMVEKKKCLAAISVDDAERAVVSLLQARGRTGFKL
jgi:heptosyltransferase-3